MVNFASEVIRERVRARNISDEDIEYAIANRDACYGHRGNTIYRAKLLDGRNIKVAVSTTAPNPITNAFTFR